jgi:hypothetical protein
MATDPLQCPNNESQHRGGAAADAIMSGASEADLLEIDAFLASNKSLIGPCPEWNRQRGHEWQRRWPCADDAGVIHGALAMTCRVDRSKPSFLLIHRRRLIYRLDLVPASESKSNPFGARVLGLPARIIGSHEHSWSANREWIRLNGFGELPYREPISEPSPAFARGFEIAVATLNIALAPGQRDVALPDQGELFGLEGAQK